ncbi:NTP transferase domain-containing protein [Sphingobium aquiterrae]|uniref:NTP transferase domain-containing protein n=1 Tax=Sphingobium aquiterrae TaxID=2038656 RepID=UPI0030185944
MGPTDSAAPSPATPAAGPVAGLTAILLAGSRPGRDPIADAAGVPVKPLARVGGLPMIDRPARALLAHPAIGRLVILTQQADLFAADEGTRWLTRHPAISFAQSGSGISQSLLDLLDGGQMPLPLLVTTADHVLLNAAMLDQFIATAQGADLAVGLVERRVLLAHYPQSRRTWLKFRDGWWSGANLFWLGSDRVRTALALWRTVEQDRKKGWRVIAAFGPLLLLGALLRLYTLAGGVRRAGRRLGLDARLVAMAQAEACIDADKPDDIALIETILASRF